MVVKRLNRVEWEARIKVDGAFTGREDLPDQTVDEVIESVKSADNAEYEWVEIYLDDDGETLIYRVCAANDPETGKQIEISAGDLLGVDLNVNLHADGDIAVYDEETGREITKLAFGPPKEGEDGEASNG